MTMLAVKNFFLPERKGPPDTPKFSRMPEVFLRSIKRRSLRVKRTKSLVVVDREKRKSDSFINSQEWTLSRSVPDLRLGIIGAVNSGKSALVHRYLTGSYTQEESPEGGRYKKEIYLDNQSYLLLIRDEGGQPEMQFAAWVDAVIFVFSLEDEYSFNAVYNYYTRMSHFRNNSEIPMILVGTQDAISEQNPRVIDEVRARKLANDMKRCPYYETCATYGLNVERVFQDACSKIVQHRVSTTSIPQVTPNNSRPSTPQSHRLSAQNYQQAIVNGYPANSSPSLNHHNMPNSHAMTLPRQHVISAPPTNLPLRISSEMINNEQLHGNYNFLQPANVTQKWSNTQNGPNGSAMIIPTENNNIAKYTPPLGNVHPPQPIEIPTPWSTSTMTKDRKDKELPTPTSTPTTSRKSRRRSNLFIPSSKKNEDKLKVNGELGSGRTIPIKQGYLYKRSSKPLNKDWKKKYVTLCSDGRLTYHSSLNDYMEDSHGKEIPLHCVTVKVPGQKPRGSQSVVQNGSNGIQNGGSQNGIISNGVCEGISGLSIGKEKRNSEKVLLTAYDSLREPNKSNNHSQTSGDEGIAMSSSNSQTFLLSDSNTNAKVEVQTPNVKKRHRRIKSSSVKNCENDEAESLDFFIISLYNKQWHFEAQTSEERDDWVNAIQQQIFKSLQGNESSKPKSQSSTATASMESIKNCVPGNGFCADCDTPDPDWASLNLGILLCIDCSGIHRKLGTHISKVRSLGLDDWPHSHLSVMLAIGNNMANSIWEANKRGYAKPTPSSIREDREDWIRRKYELKEFLLPCNHSIPIGKQIVEAVVTIDIRQLIVLMANASSDDVNSTVGPCDLRTPLHLACAIGHLVMAQILIWNNAHVNKGDQEGNTCLSYARAALANAQKSSDPHEVENVNALVDLLVALECPETVTMAYGTGTLSRRRESLEPNFEKVSSTII